MVAVQEREVPVVAVGGKGASLSSAAVFSVAHGFSQVSIDPSALDRLISPTTNPNPTTTNTLASSILQYDLTLEESRASLLIALNKLLLASAATPTGVGVPKTLPVSISEALNHADSEATHIPSPILEKCAEDLLSLLDPKHPGFPMLLDKVKEIVKRNEIRRLPKLPKGGELCSLRYDLTVPFARYVAMNGITSFKGYQIAKVYRGDNPSEGGCREFYQCEFNIAGQYETMGPDFEVIKVMTELLDALNIGDYEVKLNHRKLLDGMLDICGVPPEKFRTICSSIDKLDKHSFEQIRKEMVEEKGLSVDTTDLIGTFVKERGPPLEVLSRLRLEGSKFLENEGSRAALNELGILFKALEKSKSINRIVFDLSLARGLNYYTGVIYEVVFKGAT